MPEYTWYCAWCLRDQTDEDTRYGTEHGYLCRNCHHEIYIVEIPEEEE